jgi:MFS family permease
MGETKINTFRAFQNRNYALFFCGQSISQIGTWMQRTGVSWVVYSMTHSTFMLGLTIFASQFPSFLFSLLGGIASDRYNRYKILLLTQTISMIQAAVLAILVLTNHTTVFGLLALSAILGVVNAFDMPARQPMVHELVTDKADLPNALALNSSLVNLARLVGPALSGIVLVKFGAGICFLLSAGLMLFSHIDYFPIAMLFATMAGFGGMSQTTICLTIVQVNTEAHMRGRVMSFLGMSFFGMLPLGSLIIGSISHKIGAPNTLLCQGIIAIIIAIVFSNFLRKDKLNKKEMEKLNEVEGEIIEKI